jgi:hypothetical protein
MTSLGHAPFDFAQGKLQPRVMGSPGLSAHNLVHERGWQPTFA